MTKNNSHTTGWRKEFEKLAKFIFWEKDPTYGAENHQNRMVIESFIEKVIEDEREKEKELCKKIYIENVDWDEWAISDEEASENFEEHLHSLKQKK